MNSKQKLLVLAALTMVFAVIAGSFIIALNKREDERLSLVATFYPLAYFAEEIAGEKIEVKTLVPHNSEIHSWQPSTSDILAVDEADIVVYNGVELDHWFEEDVLPAINKENKIIVETTEGIELLKGEDDRHGDLDPHTWISPFIAKKQAQRIYEAILEKDPENQEYYADRWEGLEDRFEGLDQEYLEGLSDKQKEIIFVTHEAYGYLADRYGFQQYGVIGLSADEQPSASAIADLVDLMVEHETYVVYVDPIYSDEYANTLKNELEAQTGESVQILKLYFMLGPIDGMDYFEQQEANLENLKLGLEAE